MSNSSRSDRLARGWEICSREKKVRTGRKGKRWLVVKWVIRRKRSHLPCSPINSDQARAKSIHFPPAWARTKAYRLNTVGPKHTTAGFYSLTALSPLNLVAAIHPRGQYSETRHKGKANLEDYNKRGNRLPEKKIEESNVYISVGFATIVKRFQVFFIKAQINYRNDKNAAALVFRNRHFFLRQINWMCLPSCLPLITTAINNCNNIDLNLKTCNRRTFIYADDETA
jgi:hypothetical protein